MCDWKGHADREVSETAGPGFIQPNVRRVYQIVGTGEDRHKVLICREIDTNFDGVKDVVRRYNDKGESISEEADSNYDGKIDTWITFVEGPPRRGEARHATTTASPTSGSTTATASSRAWCATRTSTASPTSGRSTATGTSSAWASTSTATSTSTAGTTTPRCGAASRKPSARRTRPRRSRPQKKAQEEKEASDKANDAVDEGAGPGKPPPESSKRKQQPKKKPAAPPGPSPTSPP